MLISTYRYKQKYAQKDRRNSFYNGSLQAAFLNGINDSISVMDIYNAQRQAAKDYFIALNNQKNNAVQKLNIDITQYWKNSSYGQNFIEDNIVNDIWQRIEAFIETGSDIEKEYGNKNWQYMSEQIDSLQQQYVDLLRLIYQDNGQNSITIQERLARFNIEYNNLLATSNFNFTSIMNKLSNDGTIISGYLTSLYVLDRWIKGYLLEDEAVNKGKEWLPANMQIQGIGSLYVNGKQAPTDLIVLDKITMNDIQITYEKGDPKIKYGPTSLKDFFKDMELNKHEKFFISYGTYEQIINNSIAAIQAKAYKKGAPIKFKDGISLFSQSGQATLHTHSKTISKLNNGHGSNTTLNLWASSINHIALQAVAMMANINNASSMINKQSNYKSQTEQYMSLINLGLSKAFHLFLDKNQYILTAEYGLMTLEELFDKYQGWIFKWGNNKTFNLSKMASKYTVYFTKS